MSIDKDLLQLKMKVKEVDLDVGRVVKHLLVRARNLACSLLNEYTLLHTKLPLKLVKG